jgi:hypothetical protein
LPPTHRSSNDIPRNSYQDEPISSLIRKRPQNSIVDIHQPNNLSRLSLRSISYAFGPGTKTWKTIHQENKTVHETLTSSPNYRLPANKIELDLTQQEIIRRSGSFKKNDIIEQ